MNLSAIKRECMARRHVNIMSVVGGGQWISNGIAAWPVEAVRLDENAIVSLFNLTEKQVSKTIIRETVQSDARFRPFYVEGEEPLRELGVIEWGGVLYWALESARGVMFIEEGPIHHLRQDYMTFYCRWAFDRPLVAVYDGMCVAALILPESTADARRLGEIAARMAAPAYRWPGEEDEARAAEEEAERIAGQMGIGEVEDQ